MHRCDEDGCIPCRVGEGEGSFVDVGVRAMRLGSVAHEEYSVDGEEEEQDEEDRAQVVTPKPAVSKHLER